MTIKIEHVIVLMLENRSFDHMLGFLSHDNPDFGKIQKGEFTNSHAKVGKVLVNAGAKYRLAVGPNHSHKGILEQLRGKDKLNEGFVASYFKHLGKTVKKKEQKLASIEKRLRRDVFNMKRLSSQSTRKVSIRKNIRRNKKKRDELKKLLKQINPARDARKVMACFSENRVPVLSTLAKEFCVFTNWYASVPGETWPNRAFAHAATSNGEVNIKMGFYRNPTIFENLTEAMKSKSKAEERRAWAVYHDGPAHLWAYPALWHRKGNQFRKLCHLQEQIASPENAKNPLPRYCFVEPNHGEKTGPLFKKRREFSNNQHPKNNTTAIRDFIAGEQLIADIYNALKANPALFRKTLFLICYDEHGGFFDHRKPPETVAPDNMTNKFHFRSLGVRVPAVLVSPWIQRCTVDNTIREHSSIARTVRKIFIGNQKFLTKREKWAKSFDNVCQRSTPRNAATLPDVNPLGFEDACMLEGISKKYALRQEKAGLKNSLQIKREPDEFSQSLLDLSANVERGLNEAVFADISTAEIKWNRNAGRDAEERLQSDSDRADYVENVSRRLREQSP